MRKTKIVCTLGPAVSDKKAIRKLVLAGMDIARLNFSHGTPEQHRAYFLTIQDVSRELDKPIGVLQDLQGYKIRTGFLKGGQSLPVEENDSLFLVSGDELGEDKWVSISYPELYRLVKPGERIFIDDGKIELQVIRVSPKKIETRVSSVAFWESGKKFTFPELTWNFPPLLKKISVIFS